MLIRAIGKKIGSLSLDRSIVGLLMMIVCLGSTVTVESASFYSRPKRKLSYVYFSKNRQEPPSESWNKNEREAIYENNRLNEETNFGKIGYKNRLTYTKTNKMPRSIGRAYDKSGEMTRILSFPMTNGGGKDQAIHFLPGDPAGDCLEGGVDAGVVNGAVKIGIGLGLVPGCRLSTEQPPKLVPIFIPRPIPVPVPQPFPVPIDRPVAIRVPQPIPFPGYNMGPPPVMRRMRQFPSRLITGRDWAYGGWK